MVYLDYSATTPINKEVLNTFNRVCIDYPGNANSLHALGVKSKELEEYTTKEIARLLRVKPTEIIYTSGSSESNNLAIKGIAFKYKNRGNHIITTRLEHSSVIAPLNYLTTHGFEVDFVDINDDGQVDLKQLDELLTDKTILVCVSAVDSEVGIIQPIKKIAELVHSYSNCWLHVDATQAIGKIDFDSRDADTFSISSQKFYGMKGIGLLVKKEPIMLEPLIHGGKSTTVYRSGTPPLPLIVSLGKALKIILTHEKENYEHVLKLKNIIVKQLDKYDCVFVNSTSNSSAYVINFSINGVKPETFVHALEQYEIYISSKSACSGKESMSKSVYALTHDEVLASSTLRVSLSHLTTKKEVQEFLDCFDKCYRKLVNLKNENN